MATKKKKPAKRKSPKKAAALRPRIERRPVRRSVAHGATALWFQLHAEAGIVRVNVRGRQYMGEDRGALEPTGEDIDIPLTDLGDDARNLILDAFDAVAEEVGAVAFEPEDEPE